ncbi:MAG: type II toxin-antitoxin system RelE/ParE family toxin [Nitrospirae bacterium]|jgi:mRNA interferase RelE/StbE|nr:type II toxin-antitoxin system RelE/ParE family toxin [Nitrospirota bacterium]
MYQVIILPKALDDLSRLDKNIALRITDKLAWLSENFENIMPLLLSANYAGFYKLKVGDWRVIYDVDYDKQIITVHKVGHRREIYK